MSLLSATSVQPGTAVQGEQAELVAPERPPVRKEPARIWMLESLRGFAALYVVAHHLWLEAPPAYLHNFVLKALFMHGMMAVVAFFLLSGFVIEFTSSANQKPSFPDFFQRRFFRIYPLFTLALLVTWVVNRLAASPQPVTTWRDFVGNLFMLQNYYSVKAAGAIQPYGGNTPLWSLAYEWWFYMLYYPLRFGLPEQMQGIAACCLSLVGIITTYWLVPNQASLVAALFIIWWLGAECAKSYKRHSRHIEIRNLIRPLTFITAAAIVSLVCWRLPLFPLSDNQYALLKFHKSAYCYAVLAVAVAYAWSKVAFRGFRFLMGPFCVLAPISYAIYIFHYPVLILGQHIPLGFPWWLSESILAAALVLLSTVGETSSARLSKAIRVWFNTARSKTSSDKMTPALR